MALGSLSRSLCLAACLSLANSIEADKAREGNVRCGVMESPENKDCRGTVDWMSLYGGKSDANAASWFGNMKEVTGVSMHWASREDFQRYYFCSGNGHGGACGSPPCSCSRPPCDKCVDTVTVERNKARGCGKKNANTIACRGPKSPLDYKGASWPTMTISGNKNMHIFAIAGWGGMDRTVNVTEGRALLAGYRARPGPSVYPGDRWDGDHFEHICTHAELIDCFNTHGHGQHCPASCGYVEEVDTRPQQLVAEAMKARAATSDPSFILNAGGNFQWGGIPTPCGTGSLERLPKSTYNQFNNVFESMYQGEGLAGKPWFSVLGNTDWGGRVFNNGWDQQIAYTWASARWVLPAPYYMATARHEDQDFTIDMFMVDSNYLGVSEPDVNPDNNICSRRWNNGNANCGSVRGPSSIDGCPGYFKDLWNQQKEWLKIKLANSHATWQIMVTHYPCGEDGENQLFYRELHEKYGLDLMVTGHRHNQELWRPSKKENAMGGLTCIVTGGGGGHTSMATPNPAGKANWLGEGQYGFYDLTVLKDRIKIESINYDGKVLQRTTIPHASTVKTTTPAPPATKHKKDAKNRHVAEDSDRRRRRRRSTTETTTPAAESE